MAAEGRTYRICRQICFPLRNRADIASATLNILSRENAVELWQCIEPHIDLTRVVEQCRHVGRFATFMRIAERAGNDGIDSAAIALKALQECFPEAVHNPNPAHYVAPPAFLPTALHELWRDLSQLGVMTDSALRAVSNQMADACAPLTVEIAGKLESLVAEGGREDPHLPTGRWASTVRYALNIGLFQTMPISKLRKAETLLRIYNPETLLEPVCGQNLMSDLVGRLESGTERHYQPSREDLVFLDLQCFLEIRRSTVHVELTSHLVPPGQSQPLPPTLPTFKATELPHPGPDELLAVCGKVEPAIAYFGTLSPAIPTPRFLQFVRARAADTVRYHWRDGQTVTSLASSRRHEAALLAIRRDALALPEGWGILWLLRVNGKVRAVLHKF